MGSLSVHHVVGFDVRGGIENRPEAETIGALLVQVKGDAGTGFEPVTFRL